MATREILVVEDERIVAMDIQNRLRGLGYSVSAVVPSGEEAIRKVGEARPDLVVMDIWLSGDMDGIEAAGRIRALYNIPVVYVTAYADASTFERAKNTEPFGYVLKPLEEGELYTSIELALHRHQLEQRLKESGQRLASTLKSMGDGVIATDVSGRVTFMNAVAEVLTGWTEKDALGKDLTEVFNITSEETGVLPENPVAKALQEGVVVGLSRHTLISKDAMATVIIDDSVAPIRDDKGIIIGAVLIFGDATERKQVEEERIRVIEELQVALAKVKMLSGSFAVCAWCKKLRDERGNWHQLEAYIQAHSEARFNHGLCPECGKWFWRCSLE